jgi:hypothetical protein
MSSEVKRKGSREVALAELSDEALDKVAGGWNGPGTTRRRPSTSQVNPDEIQKKYDRVRNTIDKAFH